MMRVRFFQHPDRMPEWVLAVAVLGWGYVAFTDSFMENVQRHMMQSAFFAPLTGTGIDQRGWGAIAIVTGAIRLTCLLINGSRPRGSTTFRAIGAAVSCLFWFALVLGALAVPWSSGATFTYGALMVLEGMTVWKAAREMAPAYKAAEHARGRI